MFFVFRIVRRAVYLLVAAAVVYLIVTSVQVVSSSRTPTAVAAAPHSSVIVVLGTAAGKTGTSTIVAARCDQGAALYAAKKAPSVVVTGASPSPGAPVEASVLEECLVKAGVPRKRIDAVALDGLPAQLHAVAATYGLSSGSTVLIVADPFETRWVLGVASAEGLKATASPDPAPRPSFWSTIGTVWNQSLAVGFGRIFGFGHTGWVSP